MKFLLKSLLAFISLFYICLIGCSHAPPHSNANSEISPEINNLTEEIESLSTEISLNEAKQTSELLINTSAKLANEYQMVSPPHYHNFLVKIGLRDRGLCCHWAEDLHSEVLTLNTHSVKFDWLVTNLGSHLREHNALVIYASDESWQNGIVFDPWRKAGIPYWTKVSGDEYSWRPHPLSGQWEVLRCK